MPAHLKSIYYRKRPHRGIAMIRTTRRTKQEQRRQREQERIRNRHATTNFSSPRHIKKAIEHYCNIEQYDYEDLYSDYCDLDLSRIAGYEDDYDRTRRELIDSDHIQSMRELED